jgi:hypothetical protein
MLRRYAALAWVLVFVGSLFTLNGGQSRGDGTLEPAQLGVGVLLIGGALVWATWAGFAPWPGHPRPRGVAWMWGGVLAFYVVCAIGAVIADGVGTAIATLLAGIVPLTAVGLWLAHVRQKTVPAADGDHDAVQEDHLDTVPGFGVDTVRPLGDTPDAHDEITPHDLPKGHPGRPAAERLAEEGDGLTTPGHVEGGASAPRFREEREAERPRIVAPEEQREGAQISPKGTPPDG